MDWHFKPIGKTCAATGRELEPGAVCHSVVVERDGQVLRLDYSSEGWNGPPDDAVGHWQCLVPQPAMNKTQVLDPEALFRCFEQMSEDANPAHDKLRYVLALLLLQKRRLSLDGSQRDGEIEYLELTGSGGEGPYLVRDQQLSDDEIEQLQRDLNAQLAAEWS